MWFALGDICIPLQYVLDVTKLMNDYVMLCWNVSMLVMFGLLPLFALLLMLSLEILLKLYSYGCMPTLQRMKCPLFVLLFGHVGWVEIRRSWRIPTVIFYN